MRALFIYTSQVIHIIKKDEEATKLPDALIILKSPAGKIISLNVLTEVPCKYSV